MNCINCGCPDSKIINISDPQMNTNKFGREEISFTADYEYFVKYGDDGLYYCSKCGGSFTFKEAILQTKKSKDPQTKLAI